MIPIDNAPEVISSGVEGTASFDISSDDVAHIMGILRSTLYSDKPLAVLREYGANAWDANRMVGRGDKPIDVTLPTYLDPILKIRDNGPGLSKEDVFSVYNKYGRSTKRDTNDAVGSFGIGSKSGFAYSDSFTIISYHGGQKMTYVAVIDPTKRGRIDLLDSQPSDEPTGVEIQVPIRPNDIKEFEQKAQDLFRFFSPQPKINTTLVPVPTGKRFEGLGTIIDKDKFGSQGWTALMGCVPYRIDVNQLPHVSKYVRQLGGLLEFDIGSLQIAASRESLEYGDPTKETLTKAINDIIDKYVAYLLEDIDKMSQWDRRMRVRQIAEMYLPIPSNLRDYKDGYVYFNDPAPVHFKFLQKGWKGKFNDSSRVIRADSRTRLIFKNDKRALQGYALDESFDVIIEPLLDEKLARAELAGILTKKLCEGIPQVDISTLSWTKPVTNRAPVDTTRLRASCLVLDPANLFANRKSTRWTPVSRVPKDDDVYVVIESYAVDKFADFYETYANDKRLIESVGGKMPEIVGYRKTKLTPVDPTKLKGTEYRKWRDEGLVKVLLTSQPVADGLAAKTWGQIYVGGSSPRTSPFEATHPLTVHIRKVLDGRKKYNAVRPEHHPAIERAFSAMKKNEAVESWKQLVEKYPLLGINNHLSLDFLWGNHAKEWQEYIRLVDSQQASGNEEKKEAA